MKMFSFPPFIAMWPSWNLLASLGAKHVFNVKFAIGTTAIAEIVLSAKLPFW